MLTHPRASADFNPFRVIPCLLVQGDRLVKTHRFAAGRYLGDVVNALRIFNEKEVDELMVLDIAAAKARRPPDLNFIAELAGECFMPLAYGGGISTVAQARAIIKSGVEKLVVNTGAFETPNLVAQMAAEVGSQSVVVSIDVRRNWLGKNRVYTRSAAKRTPLDPVAAAQLAIRAGAGELLIHSVDRDGCMQGYDIPLIRSISSISPVPVVAVGGAGNVADLASAVIFGGAAAVAAGAMFVFHGPHRAVLISYPTPAEIFAQLDQLAGPQFAK